MWTTHVMYWLAIALAAWIAYRVGIAQEASQREDDDDALERERDVALKELAEFRDIVDSLARSRARWRKAVEEIRDDLRRERALTARLLDRLLPSVDDDTAEPMTMAEADALAVEQRRKALEREDAMVYDGREPIVVQDSDTEPPPRLVAADEGDSDGDAP